MAFLHVPNVNLKGLSASVPKIILENKQYSGFHPGEVDDIITAIGVERRRIADHNVCTSDLCYHAAEKLINDLNWAKSDIDCLVLVTQTPDYLLPATSCLLQNRLGLKEEIFTLDISLGCSGWIYGLKVLSSLLSHGSMKKGLLMVGDTQLKFCSPEDKSTYPLFGDAGAVTALEFDEKSSGFRFHAATDGSGFQAIIIPDGGFRNQVSLSSFEMVEIKPGIRRNKLQVILDGMNVFSFSLSRAPESINKLSDKFGIDLQLVDYFIFHQANLFMNERIRKKLKLSVEKVPYSLRNFGNTGAPSIPLTMISEIGHDLQSQKRNIVASGFGVGLSWGSVQFFTDNIVCSEIIEI
jgi:3-oxoacyl-[acyl-carrier-protein] synthase-3